MKRRTRNNHPIQTLSARSLHNDDALYRQNIRKRHEEEIRRFEHAWDGGSIHALGDALIFCHREKAEIPLWIVRGALYCLKMLYTGKTLNQKGRLARAPARHHSALKDYARWEKVKELEERRGEILSYCLSLSAAEREIRPALFNLTLDYSLEGRCAAVSELLALLQSSAKGATSTIVRSYKRVEKDMKKGNTSKYFIPSHQNPLRSSSF